MYTYISDIILCIYISFLWYMHIIQIFRYIHIFLCCTSETNTKIINQPIKNEKKTHNGQEYPLTVHDRVMLTPLISLIIEFKDPVCAAKP